MTSASQWRMGMGRFLGRTIHTASDILSPSQSIPPEVSASSQPHIYLPGGSPPAPPSSSLWPLPLAPRHPGTPTLHPDPSPRPRVDPLPPRGLGRHAPAGRRERAPGKARRDASARPIFRTPRHIRHGPPQTPPRLGRRTSTWFASFLPTGIERTGFRASALRLADQLPTSRSYCQGRDQMQHGTRCSMGTGSVPVETDAAWDRQGMARREYGSGHCLS